MPVTNTKSKWDSGDLLFNNLSAGRVPVYTLRTRFTTAQWNAGATLLAAVPGISYRLVSCKEIAYGGAATGLTTADVLGTQSASGVKLMAGAQASLTQSAVVTAGGTGGAVLADGASYIACDVNTAITVGVTGSALATATGIDVIIEFAMEHA